MVSLFIKITIRCIHRWYYIYFLPVLLASGLHAQNDSSQPIEFTSSDLPLVIIDTGGQEIVDDPRIIADMGIIDNGPGIRNYLTDDFNNYNGRIAIELRGSSSAWYPKKQYRFETQDTTGANLNVSLMELPAENDWILYGPYDDQSLIRNVLAYRLSNEIGRYASRTRFCELVLNGDYRGLYVLLEKIKRDANRVDIAKMEATDIGGDAVTGGYIIKLDKMDGENIGWWTSDNNITYQYDYPKPDRIVPEQESYIQDFVAGFEFVMAGDIPSDPVNGYPAYLNIDSFIDHFIINEFAKNVDAYRISAFLYKERDSDGGKMYAGPIWDFNLSFGKAWFPEDLFVTEGWQVNYNILRPSDPWQVPFWWEILSTDAYFTERLNSRWAQLRTGILALEHVYGLIDSLTAVTSEARERNFERWPETATDHSYDDEIQQMKTWISDRTSWIDNNLNLLAVSEPLYKTNNQPEHIILYQNFPNPFNAQTTIRYSLQLDSYVDILITDLRGNLVKPLVSRYHYNGEYAITWDGRNTTGQSLASGVYLCLIRSGTGIQSRKMIVLK